jgi:hypothetical protein
VDPDVPSPARVWNVWPTTLTRLDLGRSVGILLIAVLHFIPDADDPYGVVARLLAGLPSGSYLVIGHAASDLEPEAAAEMTRRNNQSSPVPITLVGYVGIGRKP